VRHIKNQVRLIGGKWRGRRLNFTATQQLRPTADRVRETVFNWLMHDIEGARCLDAFAGSGALGLEALSRGAAFVVFIDHHASVQCTLQKLLAELEVTHEQAHVCKKDTMQWLRRASQTPFDVIFLDPPFHRKYILPCLKLIQTYGWLNPDAKVYIESNEVFDQQLLTQTGWQVLRQKRSGDVHYAILSARDVTQ
jgi:16S rRNA (guanine966-N2)-methyltransferase